MACTLSNKCAKNLSKRTVLLQLIIKNVVTCFFGTQCIIHQQSPHDKVRSKNTKCCVFSKYNNLYTCHTLTITRVKEWLTIAAMTIMLISSINEPLSCFDCGHQILDHWLPSCPSHDLSSPATCNQFTFELKLRLLTESVNYSTRYAVSTEIYPQNKMTKVSTSWFHIYMYIELISLVWWKQKRSIWWRWQRWRRFLVLFFFFFDYCFYCCCQ